MQTSSSSSSSTNIKDRFLLGHHYKETGQFEKAAQIFESVLKLDCLPNLKSSSTTRSELGEIYCCLGKFEDAIKQFNLSLEVYKSFRNYAGLGNCFLRLQNPKQAIKNYEEAIARHPKGASPILVNLLANMGQAYATSKDRKGAEKYFRSAIDLYEKHFPRSPIPTAAVAYRGLGAILGLQGKPKEAIHPLKRSVSLFQAIYGHKSIQLAQSLNALGMAFRGVNKKRAIECFLAANEICLEQLKKSHPLSSAVKKNCAWAVKQLD